MTRNEATGTYVALHNLALQCLETAVTTYMLILANHLKNIIVPCYSNGALSLSLLEFPKVAQGAEPLAIRTLYSGATFQFGFRGQTHGLVLRLKLSFF